MILDARAFSVLQACSRRTVLEADWEVLRWRPKLLFDACLREAYLALSQGGDAATVAQQAKSRFVQVAANPGLDVAYGTDSYRIAKDYCAMLDTILRAAARWGLPKLAESPVVQLNSTTAWQPLAFSGADGTLHRFITVDRWGEDDLARELHSWYVFGDTAVTGMEMTLHVVEIGQQRGGRRASAWARGWILPKFANRGMHFVRKDGSPLQGWTAVWLADHADWDADEWVGTMESEGVTERLVRTVRVAVPELAVREDTLAQVMQEAARAGVLITERRSRTWRAIPMSRAACDGIVPCPFQSVCHQTVTDIADLGLYRIRNGARLAVA